MDDAVKTYWKQKCETCAEAFRKNNFEVYLAGNLEAAEKLIKEKIDPAVNPHVVSWGDSKTLLATGVLDFYRKKEGVEFIEINGDGMSWDEQIEQRRKALQADLFFTGTNAVTEDGLLVNLDMIGNRTGAITFGPKHVVLLIGRNKICSDLDTAMERVKHYAAPVNAIRFNLATPCVGTSECDDCSSDDRICNVWTITEKSFPAGRIKIILINQDLGF
ncbi:MAG: lactate utilization protein [Spirochaetales bacterium]|nr:lactate utilization protein [Spirochaetales bacterium]